MGNQSNLSNPLIHIRLATARVLPSGVYWRDRSQKTFKIPQITFSRKPKPDKTKMSRVRQNFHEESEASINKQINMEMHASYVYLAMSSFFNREDQALPGFAKFFRKASDEERDHSMKLIEYQNMRGG